MQQTQTQLISPTIKIMKAQQERQNLEVLIEKVNFHESQNLSRLPDAIHVRDQANCTNDRASDSKQKFCWRHSTA